MKTRKREHLVSSRTDTVLSLPHPPPSNAGVGVKQINHVKSEGLFGRGLLGRVPFESVPEEQIVPETLDKKFVPGSESKIDLKILRQNKDYVDRRQLSEIN